MASENTSRTLHVKRVLSMVLHLLSSIQYKHNRNTSSTKCCWPADLFPNYFGDKKH